MKKLKELLLEEKFKLEKYLSIVKNRLQDVPEGSLRLSKTKNYIQYYHCTEENKFGKYIGKGNESFIQRLAQKSYDEKVMRLIEKRIKQIEKLADDYENDEIEKIYLKQHRERQCLIEPVEPTWEQKLNKWKSSKYECPIYLKGIGIVYPDFTFLSKKTGEEVYWEHNGKVDAPKYARKMVKKIQAYENNGIFAGEKLILTYETEQMVLNTGKIEQLAKRYL